MTTALEHLHEQAMMWIEHYADCLSTYTRFLGNRVEDLNCKAPFETRMEAALDRAERELGDALIAVRIAKRKYQSLEDAA